MKITNKQIKNLELIKYFIPNNYDGRPYGKFPISAEEAFILKDVYGKETPPENIKDPYELRRLEQGKRWLGIYCHEMVEPGILDGSMPYWVVLGGCSPKEILPRNVVDFMKKELFRGQDDEIIENCYQKVLKHWNWWRRLLFKLGIIK